MDDGRNLTLLVHIVETRFEWAKMPQGEIAGVDRKSPREGAKMYGIMVTPRHYSSVHDAQTVYVMGKEQMRIKKGTSTVRRLALEAFLWIRENSRTKMADMNIPMDSLVEVGFVKEI